MWPQDSRTSPSWSKALAQTVEASLADAEPRCWWLEDDDRPDPHEPLAGTIKADLAVVGGGYSGLWTALLGKQNLAGIVGTISDFAIDCKMEQTGELRVATQPYQLDDIAADFQTMLDFGDDAE